MSFDYIAWIDGLPSWWVAEQLVPNTFRLRPAPRRDFIDARRDDGCVPVITGVRDA